MVKTYVHCTYYLNNCAIMLTYYYDDIYFKPDECYDTIKNSEYHVWWCNYNDQFLLLINFHIGFVHILNNYLRVQNIL